MVQTACMRIRVAVQIADTAVHIPFHIFNLRFSKDCLKSLHQVISDVRSRHIQNQLIAAVVRHASRNLQRPVRMLPVQIAVLRYHLRLKPESELHTHLMNFLRQRCQAAPDLLLIHKPVAKSAVIVIALSEPAVIQYQHLNSKLLCLSGNFQDLVIIKIKICRFPVVDQNRTARMLPRPAAHMLAKNLMVRRGQAAKSLSGIRENCLRRKEILSCFQLHGKPVRMNSHLHSGLSPLIHLCRRDKVSAVCQAEAKAFSGFLSRVPIAENHCRIVLMA